MSVDLAQALGHQFAPVTIAYTEKDVSLYGLSIGAAANPLDAEGLKFVYELNGAGFYTFPTYAVTFPFSVFWEILNVPGLKFNPMMLLHGEQYLELKRPLPTKATITNHARVSQIYDKGSGALVIIDVVSKNEAGEEVAFNQSSAFIRGLGGFGGERGPSSKINLPPEREPDVVVEEATQPNQALIYRLASGDGNPLHADPRMAAIGGFDRPILHGLCTFGFAARAVLQTCADNDPARFQSIRVRFSKHFFPGETLITEIWRESDSKIIFHAKVKERNELVLTNAAMELN